MIGIHVSEKHCLNLQGILLKESHGHRTFVKDTVTTVFISMDGLEAMAHISTFRTTDVPIFRAVLKNLELYGHRNCDG